METKISPIKWLEFFFNLLHKEIFKLVFIFFYYLFLFTNIIIIILYIILYYKNFLIKIDFNDDYIKIADWNELRNFKYKFYYNKNVSKFNVKI